MTSVSCEHQDRDPHYPTQQWVVFQDRPRLAVLGGHHVSGLHQSEESFNNKVLVHDRNRHRSRGMAVQHQQ